MATYSIFDVNGAHVRTVSKPTKDGAPKLNAGEVFFEGSHEGKIAQPLKDRIEGIQLTEKQPSNVKISCLEEKVATGIITLSNLVNPTKVSITGNGQTFIRNVNEKSYDFMLDTPGDYVVSCESQIELPIEFKVRIT